MQIPISTVADIGLLVRATRRTHGLRLDDVAGSAQLGTVFVGDVEHGKETVQMGKVLQLLDELGIHLVVDVPATVQSEWEQLKKTGLKARKLRQRAEQSSK